MELNAKIANYSKNIATITAVSSVSKVGIRHLTDTLVNTATEG